MDIIGIICEYNPFHHGHKYMIDKIKELYPNSIIILCLNGYFTQRGNISIETKEEKTRLALKYGVDIVIEHPFFFSSNSSDTFAESAITMLNELGINKLIFGSESNDIETLKELANKQLDPNFDELVKKYMDEGINYPTALNKALGKSIDTPNDLLGISYIKAILKNKYNIEPITIQRTNNYHDLDSNEKIISANNIREKLKSQEDISKYIPEGNIISIDENKLFNLIKYKILTDDNLDKYLTVDEGIDNRLKEVINECNSLDELIKSIKTKRYTYNRISRMLIHILIGLTKEDRLNITTPDYIRLLGFTNKGKDYLNNLKNNPCITKVTNLKSKIFEYELRCANIYKLITNEDVLSFEFSNKPIIN